MGCTNCNGKTNVNCNCNCPPGDPGKDGVSFVFVTSVENPSANCLYGGIKIQGGPDANNDGVPDIILETKYVCNGAPGQSRAIQVIAEPAGANCASGGFKIITGDDYNHDGIPDGNLIISYVCNGVSGTNGITPILITGVTNTIAPGMPAASAITPVPGSPNTYTVSFNIPRGANGNAGTTSTSGIQLGNIVIPLCLQPTLSGVSGFDEFLSLLMAYICGVPPGPSGFYAERTTAMNSLQTAAAAAGYIIVFNNDSTGGFYDPNGEYDHLTGKFTSTVDASMQFKINRIHIETVENVALDTVDGLRVYVRLIRNRSAAQTTIRTWSIEGKANLAAWNASGQPNGDDNEGFYDVAGRYEFPELIQTTNVLSGDEFWVELQVQTAPSGYQVYINSRPTLRNT